MVQGLATAYILHIFVYKEKVRICYHIMNFNPLSANPTKWSKHFPFRITGLFLYHSKISENQRFSDVFRRYRKRSVVRNGLIYFVPMFPFRGVFRTLSNIYD